MFSSQYKGGGSWHLFLQIELLSNLCSSRAIWRVVEFLASPAGGIEVISRRGQVDQHANCCDLLKIVARTFHSCPRIGCQGRLLQLPPERIAGYCDWNSARIAGTGWLV